MRAMIKAPIIKAGAAAAVLLVIGLGAAHWQTAASGAPPGLPLDRVVVFVLYGGLLAEPLNRFSRTNLAMQQALADAHLAAGTSDAYVDEELGECLLTLGQPQQARPYFARAYSALSQDAWLAEAEPARLERLRQLQGMDR